MKTQFLEIKGALLMKYPELKGKCKEYIEKQKCLRLRTIKLP